MREKEPQFTVTDRRKFTAEGELREGKSKACGPNSAASSLPSAAAGAASRGGHRRRCKPELEEPEAMDGADTIPEPTAAESAQQNKEYLLRRPPGRYGAARRIRPTGSPGDEFRSAGTIAVHDRGGSDGCRRCPQRAAAHRHSGGQAEHRHAQSYWMKRPGQSFASGRSVCCRMRSSICGCRFSKSRMRLPIPPSGHPRPRKRTNLQGASHPSSRDHDSWQWHLDGCADAWLQLPGLHFCRPARSPHPTFDCRHLGGHRVLLIPARIFVCRPWRRHRPCGRGVVYTFACRPRPGFGRARGR